MKSVKLDIYIPKVLKASIAVLAFFCFAEYVI